MAIFGKKTKKEDIKETSVAVSEQVTPTPPSTAALSTISITRPMLVKLHASEKAYAAQAHRGYVFVVRDEATKSMVRSEVEKRYKVNVENICMVRHKGKVLRLRGGLGRRPHIKKAVVTLKEGQSIDLT